MIYRHVPELSGIGSFQVAGMKMPRFSLGVTGMDDFRNE